MLSATAAAACLFLTISTWSTVPYWPDADGYTSHIARGEWVAHPPGYPFFVTLGMFLHAIGLPPYPAAQAASLALSLAALPVMYGLLRRASGAMDGLALTALFACSWNVLLLSHTGTSHAADYFTVSSLLLIITSSGFREGRGYAWLAYGAAIVLCAGFRLTTAIMMGPVFVLVLLRHWRRPAAWIVSFSAGLAVIGLQLLVVHLSGGWGPYSGFAHSMHEGNRFSSLLLSGVNSATIVNVLRTGLWFLLGLSCLPLLPFFTSWRRLNTLTLEEREVLRYAMASVCGTLALSGLYLCTHPGYVSAAMPGGFAMAAVLARLVSPRVKQMIYAASLAGTLAFFSLVRPITRPATSMQAAANGLFLQYTAFAGKHAIFKTTSGWLRDAGLDAWVPENRRHDLDAEKNRP